MTSAEDSTSAEDAMSSENAIAGEDTAEDDGPSSTLPRRQLGRFLRESRDATGFTIARAAKQVDLSRAVLQRIETPVVFIDGGASPDVYLEKPEEIRRYRELVAAIRDTCLDEVQSRSLLRQVAKEYERSER